MKVVQNTSIIYHLVLGEWFP